MRPLKLDRGAATVLLAVFGELLLLPPLLLLPELLPFAPDILLN